MPGYSGSNYNTKSLSGGSKKKSRGFSTFAKQLRNVSKKNKSMKKMKGGSSCGNYKKMKGGSSCGNHKKMKGGSSCGNHKKMKGGSSCGNYKKMKGGSSCGNYKKMKGGSSCGNYKKMKGGFIRDFSPMRNVSDKKKCRS